MSVADKFKVEKEESGSTTSFLKSKDMDNGIALTVVSMDVFTPENAEYGITNTYGPGGVLKKENWFISKGLLKEGQSFRYTFKVGDVVKTFDNSSVGFYFAFTNLNPNQGDEIWIKRKANSQTDIEWTVEPYNGQYGATSEAEEALMNDNNK